MFGDAGHRNKNKIQGLLRMVSLDNACGRYMRTYPHYTAYYE